MSARTRIRPVKRPVPWAIRPGQHLAEQLDVRHMSQSELARRMGRPVQVVNEVIRGVKQITAQTALQLERVLGIDAIVWMRLEADYRLNKARLAGRAGAQATRTARTA